MNTEPYNIHIILDGKYVNTEIRPCCKANNVVDYAIWIKGKLEFTVAKNNKGKWIVAMQNADDEIEAVTIRQIGTEIDKRNKLAL